jgi:hypothetical protein
VAQIGSSSWRLPGEAGEAGEAAEVSEPSE